jgi:hypothetical protein
LICLLHDLAEGVSMEDALKLETGLTGAGLVSAWRSWAGL